MFLHLPNLPNLPNLPTLFRQHLQLRNTQPTLSRPPESRAIRQCSLGSRFSAIPASPFAALPSRLSSFLSVYLFFCIAVLRFVERDLISRITIHPTLVVEQPGPIELPGDGSASLLGGQPWNPSDRWCADDLKSYGPTSLDDPSPTLCCASCSAACLSPSMLLRVGL